MAEEEKKAANVYKNFIYFFNTFFLVSNNFTFKYEYN